MKRFRVCLESLPSVALGTLFFAMIKRDVKCIVCDPVNGDSKCKHYTDDILLMDMR